MYHIRLLLLVSRLPTIGGIVANDLSGHFGACVEAHTGLHESVFEGTGSAYRHTYHLKKKEGKGRGKDNYKGGSAREGDERV